MLLEVAKLAGVPHEIIKRARVILDGLEKKRAAAQRLFETEEPVPDEPENVSFEDLGAAELRDRIAALDMDMMTPRDALDTLYELKKLL